MASSSIDTKLIDKQQIVHDITAAVKSATLEIAKKEILTKKILYGIQYRLIQTNKTLAPNRWQSRNQSIDKEERDKHWEEIRANQAITRNGDYLIDLMKDFEYRKTIQIENVLIGETYDNIVPVEELWAMIIGQGISKSDLLREAVKKIIEDADKDVIDEEKENLSTK